MKNGLVVLMIAVFTTGLAGCSEKANEMPAAEKSTQQSKPAPAPATNPAPKPAPAPVASTTAPSGKSIYESSCIACHAMAVAGAPKFGDAESWAPRIAKGMDKLYSNSINGFKGESGIMPPKGGRLDLGDDAIKAAVDYMVKAAQ